MNGKIRTEGLLVNKKVILLGGSSGLGLAAAMAAAAEGAHITIVSGNRHKIDTALQLLPEASIGLAIDLTKEDAVRDFFKTTGPFDHLVYTAGENLDLQLLADTELDKARDFFTLRFWGACAAVKYAAPLIRPGGSMSLTSGTAGARPGSGWSMASSICGAVEGFVRAMAVELAPLRVNCVVPGVIETGLWDVMPEKNREDMYRSLEQGLLLRRVGQPEDVAAGFLYLMTQRYGTGQSLLIDGGTVLV